MASLGNNISQVPHREEALVLLPQVHNLGDETISILAK